MCIIKAYITIIKGNSWFGQGELATYVHFPKDWTANNKRPAIVFFFGGAFRTGTIKEFLQHA